MIYTVFPKDDYFLPQDFKTLFEAKKYAEELQKNESIDSDIQATEGEIV